MKNLTWTLTVLLAMTAFQPAISQSSPGIEKEISALVDKYFQSWNAQDLEGVMDCFGKPEGLLIAGGTTYTLDSLRVIWPRDYWSKRKEEKFLVDEVKIVTDSKTTATAQVTYSGHFTYIPTDVTWDFNKSAFMTCVVKKVNNQWKIVAFHASALGKQRPKPKN